VDIEDLWPRLERERARLECSGTLPTLADVFAYLSTPEGIKVEAERVLREDVVVLTE
jgi:hypothetical protein